MISCIITTYNRAVYIERAINSIVNQTYDNLEIIIVDDGSTDNTSVIVNKITDNRIRYVYQNNKGAQAARNKGIKLAKGEYIAFLDSDDMWTPNKLSVQIEKIKKNHADILISKFERHSNGRKYNIPSWEYEGEVTEDMLGKSFFATTGTIFGKKECIENIMFDLNVSRFQDFDFIVSAIKKYKIVFTNNILLIQYETAKSITNETDVDKVINTIDYLCDKHQMLKGVKKFLYKKKLKIMLKNKRDLRETWEEYCKIDDSLLVVVVNIISKVIPLRTLYDIFHIVNLTRLKLVHR